MPTASVLVFDAAWFARHQRVLCGVLRVPGIGRLARWLLSIRRCDVGWARPIVALYPHAYVVANPDSTHTADIRAHAKYAKRLYRALKPIWWAMHWWDMAIANPLVPALNLGFDTLTTYPDPSNPGTVASWGLVRRTGVDETWSTISAGVGNTLSNVTPGSVIRIASTTTTNQWGAIGRTVYCFDTHLIGQAGGVVQSATVDLYVQSKTDNLAITPDIDLYAATPASVSSIAATDYSNIGTTSCTGSALTYASLTASQYNVLTLNSTGLAQINATGVTSFGVCNASYDTAGVAPTWSSNVASFINVYQPNQDGTSLDPRLVITFSVPGRVLKPNALRPRVFAPGRAR